MVVLLFCFCFLSLIIDGFINISLKENLTGYNLGHEKRISSFYDYILGSYLSRLTPIFIGLSLLIFNDQKRYLVLIFIFICPNPNFNFDWRKSIILF